jgi:exonuclease III
VHSTNKKMINLIQYNARSLKKYNLIEFKSYLHKHKPHLLLISETFRKDTFSVKFKQYYVVNKNRSNQPGGGVAILIHKSLQYSMLQLPNLQTIEAIGILVSKENNGQKEMLEVVYIYIPNGHQCNEDELDQLIADNNSLIISGDFNAKHGLWEIDCQHPNRSGRAVFSLLEKEEKIMLATPPNLGTRQCPNSLKLSTIDLAFMSPHLAATAEFTDLYSSPLRDPETGQLTTDLDEKARILAQQYDHTDKNSQDNPTNEQHIARIMDTPELNGLNSPITERRMRDGMSNLKSNAIARTWSTR